MSTGAKWLTYLGNRLALNRGELVLGRDGSCDVKLDERLASRKHASIFINHEECVLVDHTSRNGTYVNGVRVEGVVTLAHRDRIRIGKTELTFSHGSLSEDTLTDVDLATDVARPGFTASSRSGSASQTGANLISAVLLRNLQINELAVAKRFAEGLRMRITSLAQSGTLEAAEINAVAPALLEYCRCSREVDWVPWLLGVYAQVRLFPRPAVATQIREVAVHLEIDAIAHVEQWLARVDGRDRSEHDRNARAELEVLIRRPNKASFWRP